MPKQLQSRGHLGDPVKQPQTNFNLTMISFKYKQQTRALSTHFKMYNSLYKFIHNTCTYIQTCHLPNARLRYRYKCTVHRQLWVINVLYFNTVYRNHRCRCAKSKWINVQCQDGKKSSTDHAEGYRKLSRSLSVTRACLSLNRKHTHVH